MSTVERIRQFIEYQRISERKFFLEVGLPMGSFTKAKSIGSENLHKIVLRYPELNIDWVITGRGKMVKDSGVVTEPVIDELAEDMPGPLNPDATAEIMELEVPLEHKVVMLRELVALQAIEISMLKKLAEARRINIERLKSGDLVK